MAGRLEGKVAFITGVARGQGRAHALRLAEEGADIIGIDVPNDYKYTSYPMATQKDLDETIALVQKTGRRIVALKGDVRDRSTIVAALDAGIAEFGHLDIVVANAGICVIGKSPVEAYFESVDTDLVGVLNTFYAALPHLKSGASLIATGSTAAMIAEALAGSGGGEVAGGGQGYTFSKATVMTIVHDLALMLAPQGIRVNAVHPTNCNTMLLTNDDMYKTFRPDLEKPTLEDAKPAFPALQAMPTPWVEPEDIAAMVAFLASEDARWVTGMQMRVDAGGAIKMVKGML